MARILITAIGGDIGYGILKALQNRSTKDYFVGCDVRKYNASYDLVDEFYLCPEYRKEEQWLEFILHMIKEKDIAFFWPVTEPEIKIVSHNISQFQDVTVIMNQEQVLKVAMDKGITAHFLAENGVKTPITFKPSDSLTLEYPMIVKEKFSCGSHGICVVNNEEELKNALSVMENCIIQEYVGNAAEEYTCTIFSDGLVTNEIAFKRTLGFGGMSRFVELVKDEKIHEMAIKIKNAFDLKGSINVQMRKKDNEFVVFEINPRISSTIGFREKLGFNDAVWWLDALEGKQIEAYHCPEKKVFGVRCVEEKLFYEE